MKLLNNFILNNNKSKTKVWSLIIIEIIILLWIELLNSNRPTDLTPSYVGVVCLHEAHAWNIPCLDTSLLYPRYICCVLFLHHQCWYNIPHKNHIILKVELAISSPQVNSNSQLAYSRGRPYHCTNTCGFSLPLTEIVPTEAEPNKMYKPFRDQVYFIRVDCDSLLSCFQPKECSFVWPNIIS